MAGLTNKQEAFCQAILTEKNASEAYRRAYDAGKMKAETIHRCANELMENPKIAARIADLRAGLAQRNAVTVDRIIQGLAGIAFYDPRKFFNEDGSLKQITELDDETARALAGFDIDELWAGDGKGKDIVGSTKKVRMVDRKGALDSLARINGMFQDKVVVSGDIAALIAAARGRSGKANG